MPNNTFTPEQIAQILEEFFKVVGTRQYIGARYVPIFGRKGEESIEWDNTGAYEPLTIVLYQGNSYTSKQFVPVGVEITNQEFWALTGNYNAQVEQYRRETAEAKAAADAAQLDIDTLLPKTAFSDASTVKNYIDEAKAAADAAQLDIDTLLPKTAFSDENTVKNYIDSSIEALSFTNTFENVEAMQNATNLSIGDVCRTAGFYSADDGGGALYVVDDAETPDNVVTFAVGENLAARLLQTSDVINVLQVGFKNDGSSGNTAKFEILNSLGICDLYFPEGIYAINMSITRKNTHIKGSGVSNETQYGVTRLIPEDANTSYIIAFDNTDYSLENVVIEDFAIYGDASHDGILITGVPKSFSNDRHSMNNIQIENCKTALHVNARFTACDLNNVICERNSEYGLYVEPDMVFNLNRFVGCSFTRNGICGVFVNSGTSATTVTRCNMFLSCDIEANGREREESSIYAAGLYYNGINALDIINCYIEDNGKQNDANACNVYFGANTIQGVSIVGCLIWGAAYGIYAVAGNHEGISVNGCRIAGVVDIKANGIGGFQGAFLETIGNNLNKPTGNYFDNPNVIQSPMHLTTGSTTSSTDTTVRYATSSVTAPNLSNNLSVGKIIIFMALGAGSITFNRSDGYMLKDDTATLTINANECIAFIGIYNGYHELFRSV